MSVGFEPIAPYRKNTNSVKWDGLVKQFGEDDLIPMWIADMDFKAPPCVSKAIRKRLDHGIWGYTMVPDSYYQAFIDWEREQHGYEIQKEWIKYTPGVVSALFWFVNILTQPGETCLVLTPVYYPFFEAVKNNNRKLVCCDLINTDGIYTIDFDKLEKDIAGNDIKLLILCSPHNPVGRVWTGDELKKTLEICKKYNVYVISDEIHQDIIIGTKKHIPSAMIGEYADILVTLTAASKTFNLAGFKNSFAVIPDESIRAKFDEYVGSFRVTAGSIAGYVAVEAAYRGGQAWLKEVIEIIRGNYEYVRDVFQNELPGVVVTPLEATYLAWFDLRNYIPSDRLKDVIQKKCRIAVDYGEWFGTAGEGHIRMNLATPRKWVIKAMENIVIGIKGGRGYERI